MRERSEKGEYMLTGKGIERDTRCGGLASMGAVRRIAAKVMRRRMQASGR